MNLKQAFKMAVKSLATSKMRSFLTMLGIIIGVASVIVLVSIVNGVTVEINSQFEAMGSNILQVMIMGRGGNRTVDTEDLIELADENPDVFAAVSPLVSLEANAKSGSVDAATSVKGVNEEYRVLRNLDIAYGRALCYADVKDRLHNCVVGTYISRELFGSDSGAIGQTLKINGLSFCVVGVLDELADSAEDSSDDAIYIPYTLALKMSGMKSPNIFSVSAVSAEMTDRAESLLNGYFIDLFGSSDYHSVMNTKEILDSLNEITGMMSVMLAGIAGISLLVGGIGIMNIMLVSVTERTREIGIRKSLGATPWDIKSQFVVEAITTSAVGGVIGVLAGIGLSKLCSIFTNVALSVPAMIIAFSFSAVIGVAFGYFPAKKAAALNPIDALRYD